MALAYSVGESCMSRVLFPCYIWPLCVMFNTTEGHVFKTVSLKVKMFSNWGSVKFSCFPVRAVEVHSFIKWKFSFTDILFVTHFARNKINNVCRFTIHYVFERCFWPLFWGECFCKEHDSTGLASWCTTWSRLTFFICHYWSQLGSYKYVPDVFRSPICNGTSC
jgi:hypothetical protein